MNNTMLHRVNDLPTCCQYHKADQMPHGSCREGRDCPERTRLVQEAEQRIRQQPIGVECALPITFADKEPKPFDWQSLILAVGVVVCMCFVAALLYRG